MEEQSSPNKTFALIITILTSFLAPFMGSSVNVALPLIAAEFSMDAVILSWVTTAYLLAASALLVPFGRLADIYGRKKIFAYGIWVFTIGAIITAFAQSSVQLIAFRVFQGVGAAMLFSTGLAILTSVFSVDQRGKVLGINVAAVYLGLLLGPFVGGVLTEHLGWRSLFLFTVPLNAVIIVLLHAFLKGDWAEAHGERFDVVGSFVYIIAMVGIMCGFSWLPETTGALTLIGGIAGAIVFIKWESRVQSPILAISVLRKNTSFTLSNLATFINYSATFASGFLLSLYLQYIKGFSPQGAGMVLTAAPAVMAVSSPFAGRLSDKINPSLVATAGMSFNVAGLILYALFNEHTGLAFIIAALFVSGIGFGLFSSPNTNAVMSSVDRAYFGVASGTNGTMRATGMVFSMGFAMLTFALYMGRAEITPEYYPQFLTSMKILFAAFSVLCFGGIFASYAGKLN
jgi:EmrB/QacA subfamily drug resistance transporter